MKPKHKCKKCIGLSKMYAKWSKKSEWSKECAEKSEWYNEKCRCEE